MAIHYKFKSAKDFDSVPIEGDCVSLSELKGRIVEKMKLRSAPDFDLVVSNSQTNEEYVDGSMIPRNSTLLLRRVPGTIRMPVLTPKPAKAPDVTPAVVVSDVKNTSTDWGDDFGVDLYEDPQLPKAQLSSQAPASAPVVDTPKDDEEARIKAFCDASASEWERQTQQCFPGGRGHGRGGGGYGRGGGGFVRRVPPEGYVCHRCNEPGHFIQHCPTNKDPAYNIKRVRLPTGIPRTMLVANPSGSYALPNGEIATLKPNEELFEKEVNALPVNKALNEVPAELRCPLCREVLKDAVLTSKCCFKSFCDQCIRNEIMGKGKCVCGATNVLADTLLPNKTLRDAIQRLLESSGATSSAENHRPNPSIPDMESALPLAKAGSPSSSVSVKEPVIKLKEQTPVHDERIEDGSEGVEVISATTSEQCLQDNNNLNDEQVQPKKNKAKRRPPKQLLPAGPAGQMLEPPLMPYGAPFWPMHMNLPVGDGYMMPYASPFPYPMMPDPYNDPYSYSGMGPPAYPTQREHAPRYPASTRRRQDDRSESRERRPYDDDRAHYRSDSKRRREDSDGYRHSSYDYRESSSSSKHSSSHHSRDRDEHHSSSRSSRHRERDYEDDHRRGEHESDRRRVSDEHRRDYEDDRRRERDHERDYERDYDRDYEENKARRVSVFLRVKSDDKRCT